MIKSLILKTVVVESSLFGHQLHKGSGYLNNYICFSDIREVDEYELIFDSFYDNWHILEHIRLI